MLQLRLEVVYHSRSYGSLVDNESDLMHLNHFGFQLLFKDHLVLFEYGLLKSLSLTAYNNIILYLICIKRYRNVLSDRSNFT